MAEEAEPRAHNVVLEFLETLIFSGELRVGSQLPPERDLAIRLGVSRGAVREAIRMLRAQGIVESAPGPGRGTRITAGHTGALGKLLKLHLAVASMSVPDLTETRIALERSAASLAAMRRDSEALLRLEDLLAGMDAEHERELYNQLDTQFHVEIAAIAQNLFVGDLTTSIREALGQPILVAEMGMPDWPGFRANLCEQHRAIFNAIAGGDGELAANKVEQHIRYAYDALDLASQATV